MEFPDQYKKMGLPKRDYWKAVARHEGLPFLDEIPDPSSAVLASLSPRQVWENRCIPFRETEENIDLAIDEPYDLDLRDRLKWTVKKPIVFYLVLPETIDEALTRHYKTER